MKEEFTRDQMLIAVEAAIAGLRGAPAGPLRTRMDVLRAVARDLKARRPGIVPEAAMRIDHVIGKIRLAEAEQRDRSGLLQQLGDTVLRFWPALRATLETPEAE